MSNSADKKVKRLLFTCDPFEDESLISFIMRLAEMNEIPDIRWIYQTIRFKKIYNYDYKIKFNDKLDPLKLSQLAGVSSEKINELFNPPELDWQHPDIFNPGWHDQPRWHYFICRESPKICPAYLAEKNYCRKSWEISPVTTCPFHKCLLIDHCGGCNKKIGWNRPDLTHCRCGYDFRESEITAPDEKELRLTKLIYKELGMFFSNEEIFAEPVNKLGLRDILRILFFVGSHLTKLPDFSGKYIFRNKDNNFIHKYLSDSLNVFDDWSKNYHGFIEDHIIPWSETYFFSERTIKWYKTKLPFEFYEYELFNQVQRTVLFDEQFSFIHEELLISLEKFSGEIITREL